MVDRRRRTGDRTRTIIREAVSTDGGLGTVGPVGPDGPQGIQGVAGPQGSPGPQGLASTNFSAVAGETLGGTRAVYVAADGKAYYADPSASTAKLLLGVTTGAAALGASVTIQTEGVLTEASWSWSATGSVWLTTTGQLTQTVPATGFLVQVGVPVGPTKLRIEPQLVAQLS